MCMGGDLFQSSGLAKDKSVINAGLAKKPLKNNNSNIFLYWILYNGDSVKNLMYMLHFLILITILLWVELYM